MLKYLRIAVTALCLMVCVLLVALWVRSMHTRDLASLGNVIAASTQGRMVFYTLPNGGGPWRLDDFPSYAAVKKTRLGQPIAWGAVPAGPYVATAYWFPVLMTGALALLLWRPRRYSLRSLLIAMSLFAVGLGIA